MKYSRYKKVVAFIKKTCPTAFPVSVKLVPLANNWAICSKEKKRFVIKVRKPKVPQKLTPELIEIVEQFVIDVFLHEYAHAVAWNHLYDSSEEEIFNVIIHGPEWGVAYSKVYEIYVKAQEEGKFNI